MINQSNDGGKTKKIIAYAIVDGKGNLPICCSMPMIYWLEKEMGKVCFKCNKIILEKSSPFVDDKSSPSPVFEEIEKLNISVESIKREECHIPNCISIDQSQNVIEDKINQIITNQNAIIKKLKSL